MRLILLLLALSLSGCVITPAFHPTTEEGALCKRDCASEMGRCAGSSYTCDRAHAKCVSACIDLDQIKRRQ